jgi:hypothetical protein
MADTGCAHLTLDEAAARRLVLMQAVEQADERGALLAEEERVHLERTLLEQHGVPRGQRPDPAWYLPERARAILQKVEQRNPKLLRLEQPDLGWERLALLLPVVAAAAGFASDQLGDPHQLDLLALPLIGFVLWNFAVYLLLLFSPLVPAGAGRRPAQRLAGWLAGLPARFGERAGARLKQSVAVQFRRLWWQAASTLQAARVQRVLHVSAAAWALGVIASIAWHGLVREYRVGWESTWLQPAQVQWLANLVSAPGRALLHLDAFTLDEIERLRLRASGAVGPRWALLYIAFLFTSVVVPRALLALYAAWRARRAARAVRLDLRQPYFDRVMARVSPARWTIALRGADERLRNVLSCVLRQAGADPVLRTPQHDELAWTEDAHADADQVWLATDSLDEARAALAQRSAEPKPLLLLHGAGIDAASLGLQARGEDVLTVALADCAACWAAEGPLREALLRQVPPWKKAGSERLMQAWAQVHEERASAAARLLASVLAACAVDSEPTQSLWSGGKAREAAMAALLERLQARLAELHHELLRLYGAQGYRVQHGVAAQAGGLASYVNQGSAGAAGAVAGMAAGAMTGAHIDLLTGGLTMGAGAAIGALIGGAGAFGAARWGNLGGSVRLSDEQLQSLAESLMLQSLAVIHAGRTVEWAQAQSPVRWRSETVAAVAAEAEALRRACRQARQPQDAEQAVAALAAWFKRLEGMVLRQLYPGG